MRGASAGVAVSIELGLHFGVGCTQLDRTMDAAKSREIVLVEEGSKGEAENKQQKGERHQQDRQLNSPACCDGRTPPNETALQLPARWPVAAEALGFNAKLYHG